MSTRYRDDAEYQREQEAKEADMHRVWSRRDAWIIYQGIVNHEPWRLTAARLKAEGFKVRAKLGDRVRDKVTKFEGIATAHIRYLHGCDRFGVERESAEGKQDDNYRTFDDYRLEVIDAGVVQVDLPSGQAPG